MNYVDDVRVVPKTPAFSGSLHEIRVLDGGTSNLSLDAGVSHAGKSHVIFSGVTGTYPGFTLSGVHVPLNLDAWTWTAFSLVNSPVMKNFMGTLNGNGEASAIFTAQGPLPIEAIGFVLYFDFLVLENPQGPPASFASNPHYLLIIP